MGLDQPVAAYRDLTGYAHVVDETVRGNPDPLSAEELHAAAWPVVAQQLATEKQKLVDRFEERHGTGRASTDPAKLADAATHGPIDTLTRSGGVYTFSQTPVPGGGDMAAAFRY